MKVVKRDGSKVDFELQKIIDAIMKAMKNGSGIIKPKIAENIAYEIFEENKDKDEISIYEIERIVFDKLITKKQRLTAKAYEGYRRIREFQRDSKNTIDHDIDDLIRDQNAYWKDENANKNPILNTTKRDYMAGIVSTDAVRRVLLPPEIVQAHDEAILHFHDADYFIQHLHNCDLVNLEDMLQKTAQFYYGLYCNDTDYCTGSEFSIWWTEYQPCSPRTFCRHQQTENQKRSRKRN